MLDDSLSIKELPAADQNPGSISIRRKEHGMRNVTLGTTGITVKQNAFGALPIQRISTEAAVALLRRAFDGGMRFFDTARAYTDSEEKVGIAFEGMRDQVFIASKTMAETGEQLKADLETSLRNLKTDHLDLYQLHCASHCIRPGEGTGLYEALTDAKEQGLVRHIGITAHKIGVAEDIVKSGLYETLQYPFNYLATDRDIALVQSCKEAEIGFIAMKAISGGLLTNSKACMAFIARFDNVLPIWGIQRENELDEWLSFFESDPEEDETISAVIEADRKELIGEFCRGCGYCSPCTVGIEISQCARISQMIRRAPSAAWLTPHWQDEMAKIEACVECGDCITRCPYGLSIPSLLKKNLEDYKKILSGEVIL